MLLEAAAASFVELAGLAWKHFAKLCQNLRLGSVFDGSDGSTNKITLLEQLFDELHGNIACCACSNIAFY